MTLNPGVNFTSSKKGKIIEYRQILSVGWRAEKKSKEERSRRRVHRPRGESLKVAPQSLGLRLVVVVVVCS